MREVSWRTNEDERSRDERTTYSDDQLESQRKIRFVRASKVVAVEGEGRIGKERRGRKTSLRGVFSMFSASERRRDLPVSYK